MNCLTAKPASAILLDECTYMYSACIKKGGAIVGHAPCEIAISAGEIVAAHGTWQHLAQIERKVKTWRWFRSSIVSLT